MLRILKISVLSVVLLFSLISFAFAQDEEDFMREKVISKKNAIVLSALFPGLGQMTKGERVKGMTFFMAEVASIVFSVNAHENYNTKLKIYNRDIKILNKLPSSGTGSYYDAVVRYKDLKDKNDDLDNLNAIRNTALVVAIGVYAFNLVDAIIFSKPTSESMRAENEAKKISVKSTYIGRTPGLLLSKRF